MKKTKRTTETETVGMIGKSSLDLLVNMPLKEVNSSRVKAIGFIPCNSKKNSGTMVVEFNKPSGSKYVYFEVDSTTYEKLVNSESVGKAFQSLIVDKEYEYEKIS